MKTGSIISIIGSILIIIGILPLYGVFPNVFLLLVGILCIITGIFRNKGYFNNNYFMAVFSVIAVWGLMLLYIFLFRTNENLGYRDIYYIGLFILLIIFFGGSYIRRYKKGNL